MFALQSSNGKAVLNAKTLKQQAAKEKQDDYMMMARPDLYSDKELASRATQLLKIALQDLNNYHSTEFQMPTRSATGNFDVSAKGKVDWIKEAEENISRAYSMIRNDKILAMVKKEMGNNYNLLLQREHEHLKTDNLKNITTITDTQVTEYSDKEGKVKLTPEQIAHNKYVVTWLKSQLADLEREKKFNEAKEGWKQDFVNNTRELLFGGVTRASLADKYNLIKSNMTRLEAAAEGKLLDANGKPVSFEDAMKNLGETGIQVLEQANQDYQSAQATGEFMVDMAVLAIPLPKSFNAANTVIKMGNTLYKVISKSDKVCKVVKITQEAAKGSKIYEVAAKVATKNPKLVENARKVATIMDSSATGAMHMAGKTVVLDASNIATSREGFTSDRISEMNEKVKSAAVFGGMGGAIGGTTAVASEFVSSAGAKYTVHGVGLVADLMGAAGLMTAESHGETNFWDNLRCVNPDGSFNFEQASMTAMMIYGHLHGASTVRGKSMPKAEIQADGTVKYTLNNRELVLSKDGIFTDSETGRKFKLATNKNSKTELAELTKKEVAARHLEQPVAEEVRANSTRHSEAIAEESQVTETSTANDKNPVNASENEAIQLKNETNAQAKESNKPTTNKPAVGEESQVKAESRFSESNINFSRTHEGFSQIEGNVKDVPDLRNAESFRNSKDGVGVVYLPKENATAIVVKISGRVNDNYTIMIDGKIPEEQCRALVKSLKDSGNNRFDRQQVADILNKQYEMAETSSVRPETHTEKSQTPKTEEKTPVSNDKKPVKPTEGEAIQQKQNTAENTPVTTTQNQRTGNTAEQAKAIHNSEVETAGVTPVQQTKAQQLELERLQTLVQSNEGKAILADAMKDPNFGKPLSERVPDEGFKMTEDGRLQIEVDGVVYTQRNEGDFCLVSSDGKILEDCFGQEPKNPSATDNPNLTRLYRDGDGKILGIENQYGAIDYSHGRSNSLYYPAGKPNTSLILSLGRTTENYIMTDNVGRVIYNYNPQLDAFAEYHSTTIQGRGRTMSDSNIVSDLNQAIQDVNLKNTTFSTKKGRQKAYEDVRKQIDNAYKDNKLTGQDYDNLVTNLNAKAEEAGGLVVRETSNQGLEAIKSKRYESIRNYLSDKIDKVATKSDYDNMVAEINESLKKGNIDSESARVLNETLDAKGKLIEGVETLSQKKAKIEKQVREIETAQRIEAAEAKSRHQAELLDEYLAEFGENLPSEIGTKEYYDEALSTIDIGVKNGSIEPQKAEVLRTQLKEQLAKLESESNKPAETDPASHSKAPAEESQVTETSTANDKNPVNASEGEAIQPKQNTAETKTEPKTGNTFEVSTDDIPTTLSDMQKSLEKSHENVTRIDKDKNTVIYSIKNDETGGVMHVQFTDGKRSSMTIVKANDLQTHIEFAADGKTPLKIRTDFIDNGKIFTRVEDRTTGQIAFEEPIVLNGERSPIGFAIENDSPLVKRFSEGSIDLEGKFTPKEVNEGANMSEEVFSPYEVIEQNAEGKPTKTALKDGDGNVLEYNYNEYDSNGNVAKTTSKGVTDKVTASHEFEYDSSHNLIKETVKDADGKIKTTIESEYNDGKLTKEIIKNAEGTTENVYRDGELAEITEYEYQNGKVVKSIKKQLKNDEVVSSTESEYNDGKLVKSTKSEYEKGELVGITESEYKDGNLTKETWVSADGKTTKITKNEYKDGTLIKSREELKTDNSTEITEKEYKDGNLVKEIITNKKGIIEQEYNNGKLITETIKDVNGNTTQISKLEYKDQNFRPTKETKTQYKEGKVVKTTEYEYDDGYKLIKTTQKDADGNITQVTEKGYSNINGAPTKETKTQFKDGEITEITETEYKDLNPTKEIQKDANGKITKIYDHKLQRELTAEEIKEYISNKDNNTQKQEQTPDGNPVNASEGEAIQSPFEITADKFVVNGNEQPIPTFEEAQRTLKKYGGNQYSIETGDGNRLIFRYDDNGKFIGSREEISINGKALKDTSRNADGTLDKTIDYFHTNDGEPVLIERDSNGKPTKIKWYKRNITFNKEGKASYEVTNEKNETINKPIEEVLKDSPELQPLLEKQGIKLVEESNSPVPPVVENKGEGTPAPENKGEETPAPENNGKGEQKTPTQEEITAQQEIVNKIKNELNKIKPELNEEQANKDLKAAEKEFDILAEKTLKKARKIGKNVDLQTIKKALLSDEKYDSLTDKHKQIVNKYKKAKANVEAIKKQQELQNKLTTEQQKLDSMQEAAKANEKNTTEANNNEEQPVTPEPEEQPVIESESESAPVNTETPTPAKPSMFDRLFHRNKVKLEKEVASGEKTIGDYKFNTVKDENGYVRTKTNNFGEIEGKEYFNAKGKKIKTEEYYSDGKIVTEGNVTTEYYVDDDVDIVKYPNHKEVKFIYNEESYELEGAVFTEKHNPLHPKRLVVFDFTKGNTSSSTKRRTYYEYNSDKKHFELKNEKGEVVGTATFDPETRHWVEDGQYSSDLAPKTTNVSRGEGRFRIKLPERNKVPKNLRDENGNLREGVKPFNDGYTETISKGGVEITKGYDSKGTLLLEVSKEKATYYNAKGEVIAEEKPIPNGVQRTEFSKDYDLEINMKADKDRTPETAFIRYKSGPEADAPVEFKYNEKSKLFENTSPEGTVLKTLKYDAKNHSWTIKNAKGKTIETQENRIESSHKARNFVAGTTLVGGGIALVGVGLQMIAPEKPDYPLNTESQKPTTQQTTQPTTKPKTEQSSNKVTLGDQEGTIDKNTGTITIDGAEYPKNPDATYNINGKTYKLEGNKLVEVVDTPDDNGETGGADPDESPEVKGTIGDKEYIIKDGKVSVDGEELTPDENGHYTIGDDKYKIEYGKLVKVEPEASAKATNSSTQTSGGSSGGSASGTTGSQSDRRTGGSASGTTGSQAGGRTGGSASGTTGSQAGGRTDGSGTETIGSQNENNQKDSSKFFEEILRQNVINDMNQKRVQPEQTIQTQDDVITPQEPQRIEKRKITPQERMELTEKISKARNRENIEKIQKEMRKYKVFSGRKNLRRAYKAKLRAITHDGEQAKKYDGKFKKRWEKITESDVYKSDKSKQYNDLLLKKLNYVDYITNTSVDIDPNGFNA